MSSIAVAAAKTYILLAEDQGVADEAVSAREFYRCLVDIGRERGYHTIQDGTTEYMALVDALEYLHMM